MQNSVTMLFSVIPAPAGIQKMSIQHLHFLDSRFRGSDDPFCIRLLDSLEEN